MFKGCSECLIEGTDYSWFIAIFRVPVFFIGTQAQSIDI